MNRLTAFILGYREIYEPWITVPEQRTLARWYWKGRALAERIKA